LIPEKGKDIFFCFPSTGRGGRHLRLKKKESLFSLTLFSPTEEERGGETFSTCLRRVLWEDNRSEEAFPVAGRGGREELPSSKLVFSIASSEKKGRSPTSKSGGTA